MDRIWLRGGGVGFTCVRFGSRKGYGWLGEAAEIIIFGATLLIATVAILLPVSRLGKFLAFFLTERNTFSSLNPWIPTFNPTIDPD